MKKRITALLLALCLIFSAAPVYAGAATGQQVSANAVTVTAGNTASVTLKAENFENIAALDVYVYYDASVFTVSGTTNGNMLSGAQASVNTADAGTIVLSAIALTGISGSGNLLTVRFATSASCDSGTYPITVAVGRAHNGDLKEAAVSGVSGSVTVNKSSQTQYFYLSGSVSASTVRMGDTLSCYVYNSNSYSFVSGEFTFTYDHELFAFDSVTLGSGLEIEGAIHSVNSSVLGQVRIVYANDNAVSSYQLFTVNLKAIADVDTTTTVKAQTANMYRADFSMYQPGSWSRSVMLKKQQQNDYPDAFLRSEQMIAGQESAAVFYLEAGAGIAAADFTLTYDPTVLRCVSVTMAEGVSDKGGMIIINEKFADGAIRFSYVNMDAYDETELPLVKITWEPLCSPAGHYQITCSGKGVVDTDQKPIALDYVTDSEHIFIRTVVPPQCLADGYTDHVCACGENFQTDTTPMLGHDIQQFAAKEETCTQVGWGAYEGCSRCDYGTYVEIPALGHDEIPHTAQVQTCLGIGWESYVTCSRCDYTTYEELPALGHDEIPHAAQAETCTAVGWDAYVTCSRCDYTTYVEIPALGHDEIPHAAQKETCTTIGWESYVTCSRCDYSTYAEIPALGHDEIPHEAQAQTCTTIGWDSYVTCSRCDYTTYQELPPLGHRVYLDRMGLVDPLAFQNDGALPFEVIDGVYYSQNHTGSSSASFTVTALYDCTVTVIYSVSSESNYDKLYILRNGAQLDVISGVVSNRRLTLDLVAGDVLTLRYSKDGSVNNGEDRGWVRFEYDHVMQNVPTLVPAEEGAPTCDKAVVCVGCGLEIKAALGHNMGSWHTTLEPTCEQLGTLRSDCSRCDHADYKEIPALGHDEIPHEGKAATCLDIGWESYVTCSRCDYSTYEELPALGHDEIPHTAQAQTCLGIGWESYVTCSRCDYSTYEELPALGHDEIPHAAQAETCTAVGWDAYVTCSRCDYTTYVEIPPLGHDEIPHAAQKETCTTIGWESYVTCSRCDYTTYTEIPATGHTFINKVCTACGEAQTPAMEWDVSANSDGTVMAYAYAQPDGTYLLEITGSGATKNYTSSPFYSQFSDKIGDIRICQGVTTIGNYLFRNLTISGEVYIADSVTDIGMRAFYNISGPKTITLPASVTTVGNYGFYTTKGMILLLQGDKLPTSLGNYWNDGCGYYLQPQQVIETDDALYVIDGDGKAWLAKYYNDAESFVAETSVGGVPVTGIGAYAFDKKNDLTTYTVPGQITSIGRYAFRQCKKLTILLESDALPASVDSNWYDQSPYYLAPQRVIWIDDTLYVQDKTGQMYLARYLGSATELTLPGWVEGMPVQHIGKNAFRNSSVQTVVLPDMVETIEDYGFYNTPLKQITLPDGLTAIGAQGFYSTDLTSVIIPETVTTLGSSAFSACSKLKVVYIKSPTIVKQVTSTYAAGYLCNYAKTVAIPTGVENTWLSSQYTSVETAWAADMDCTIYSKCTHAWQETVISEMVTCQTDGISKSVCSSCLVEKQVVVKCHEETFFDAKAPSCTEYGWKAYVTCSRCAYSTYQQLPALGHAYRVSFSWNSDHDACEATFVCARDCGLEATVDCVVTRDQTDPVMTVHTATAVYDGVSYTNRMVCDNFAVGFYDWDNSLLCQNYYHLGDTVGAPEAPARGADNTYTYTFAGWDKEITVCDGNATYRATYTPTYIDYKVAFQNWDGTVLFSQAYHYGDPVTPPAAPTKAADNTYTYTFAGWDREVVDCAGDATYTATYNPVYIDYTVVFKNWDGTVLSTQTYHYGDPVTPPADPTKAADEMFTYIFKGWDKEVVNCVGNAQYQAVFAGDHQHTYGAVVTAPSCTHQGYTVYTCICGDTYKDAYVNALGHDMGQWYTAQEPTCTKTGTKRTDCSRCDYFETETLAIVPHTYTAKITAPTCIQQGYTTHTCACGDSYVDSFVDATGHSHAAVVTTPTCLNQGYTTHTCHCGDSYVDSFVDALGHSFTSYKSNNDATCTQDGTETAKCDRCAATDTRTEADSAKGHSHVAVVTAPTCTQQGYTTHTCACGDSYKDTYVTAKGHTYVPTVVKPTPGKQGYTQHTCHCGDYYRTDYVAALDLSVPKVSITVDAATGKPALRWADGGEGVTYEIHRATSKTGKYTKAATVAEPNWIDTAASVGKTYYYKVKATYAEDTSLNSDFGAAVSATAKCATPNISVENDAKGKPYITWEKVSGAKKYTVYRATSETGKYTKLGTTTKAYYTDSKASAGNTYYYKVVANASKSKYSSGYSDIVSCGVICGTPSVTAKVDAATGKPSLSWSKISGATGYAIYRDGQYLTKVSAASFTDTTAAIDTRYTYTVQALGKTGNLDGAQSKMVAVTSGIARPSLTGSINENGKPVITWNEIEGAVKYEVYRSTKSSKSYKLVEIVEGLTYTDETVSAGKTYYYKVKAIGEVSKSADSSYVKLTGKCATPEISVSNDAKGKPYISWEKVSGAKKYTVYRATSETGKYTKLGTTTKAYYTDSKASAGTTYFYKIIANASSSKNNSPYSNIVSCGVNCATPVVKVTTNASGQPVLSWSKVTGAQKYEIYLLGADDYVTLATVTGTSWTDENCGIGEGRYYGVRAVAAQESYNSEVSTPVFARGTCATPKLTGKVGDNKKPLISWNEVDGAVKYEIYRSTSKSKGYKVIGESETLTYEDLTAKKGKTYYYKVVAVGENCESAQSAYVKIKSK